MICSRNLLLAAIAGVLTLTFFMAPASSAEAVGSNAPPAAAADERKTAAEWLEVINAENAQRLQYEAAHPEETKLFLGACWAYDSSFFYSNTPPQIMELYTHYQNWVKREGEAAFDKWRKKSFPISDDPHYLLLHAMAVKEAASYRFLEQDKLKEKLKDNQDLADYANRIETRGKAVLLKGIVDGRISRSELDELRLFAILMHYNYGIEQLAPGHFGWMPAGVQPGWPAPDFTLPPMEDVLRSPAYTDEDPNDRMNEYRPHILTEILQIMDGYEAVPQAESKPGNLVRAKPYGTAFKNAVTLSSFRGKKPVVFMCSDATDTWDYCGRVTPLWGPLYCAIKDRVEVYFIHTTVHDYAMPNAPFGNFPYCQWAYHPLSQEARARTAKMCYMDYPTLCVPYLLDDKACHVENAYQSDGGGAFTYMVDKQGTVSCTIVDDSIFNSDYQKYARDNSNGGSLEPFPFTLREMNAIECNLKVLLDAGGVWNGARKPTLPDWRMSPMLENVLLAAVDASSGDLTVTDKDHKSAVIAVDAQTRIVQNGKRVTSSDLKPEQTLQISYQKDSSKKCGQVARIVMIGGSFNDFWWAPVNWVPAEVQSIDLNQGVVTVTMTLLVQECKGPGLWETATPELFHLDKSLTNTVPAAFKAIAAQKGKLLTLHIDRCTELFLNGMTAHLGDLKVGDKIGIDLPDGFNPNDVWPHFVRVYRY